VRKNAKARYFKLLYEMKYTSPKMHTEIIDKKNSLKRRLTELPSRSPPESREVADEKKLNDYIHFKLRKEGIIDFRRRMKEVDEARFEAMFEKDSSPFEKPEKAEMKLLGAYRAHLKKLDVFATGVTLAKFLIGAHRTEHCHNCCTPPLDSIPNESLREVLSKMLNEYQSKRPNMRESLQLLRSITC